MPRNEVTKDAPAPHPTASKASISTSSHVADSKISADDFAFNKIFVGGLHYDTRDGKISVYMLLQFAMNSDQTTYSRIPGIF